MTLPTVGELKATVAEISALGVKSVAIDRRHRRPRIAQRPCSTRPKRRLGPLTTLVNNAGVSVLNRGDLLDVTPESYDRCLAVNTRGTFFLTQAFARRC